MTDLEKLISDAQDRLRGRPRDWIDDFGDWRRGVDWTGALIVIVPIIVSVAIMLWLAL